MGNDLMLLMARLGLSPMSTGQAFGGAMSPLNRPSLDRNALAMLLQRARSANQYDPHLMQMLRSLMQRVQGMAMPEQMPFKPPVEFGGMNAIPFPVPQQLVQQLMQYMNPQG